MNGYQRVFLVLVCWVGVFCCPLLVGWLEDSGASTSKMLGFLGSAFCFVVMVTTLLGMVKPRKSERQTRGT